MNIREIENSIITKLKTEFPEILVEGFPDKPSEFILLHPIGALLIHYQGSNYSTTNALGFISQENKKGFSITVVTRNLRSNQGAYEYIDKVKEVLTGYQIDECSKLMPIRDNFISENGGIWQYGIDFTLTTTNIQTY
nr:MAG TPA: tail completion protein [Caudoviricetes sp.]